MNASPLILLHPQDNVLIVREPVASGVVLSIDGRPVTVTADLHVGHKVARHALEPGERVLKYGAPVGSMTAGARPGDHVHLHNMKSDYIPIHSRRGGDAG